MLALLAAAAAATDACALLPPQEIAAVQGETPSQSTATARDEGPLHVSGCVFVLPTFARSIALEVTRGAPGAVRKRWRRLFHSRQRGEEGEEQKAGPERVRGLGDEAYWLAEKPSGALYVLRRNAILRISLGGPDAREAKVARARVLLGKALRRL